MHTSWISGLIFEILGTCLKTNCLSCAIGFTKLFAPWQSKKLGQVVKGLGHTKQHLPSQGPVLFCIYSLLPLPNMNEAPVLPSCEYVGPVRPPGYRRRLRIDISAKVLPVFPTWAVPGSLKQTVVCSSCEHIKMIRPARRYRRPWCQCSSKVFPAAPRPAVPPFMNQIVIGASCKYIDSVRSPGYRRRWWCKSPS